MTTDKDTYRKQAIVHRAKIDRSDESENPEVAADIFISNVPLDNDPIVALYWPKDTEFDVTPLFEKLIERQIACALPIMQKDSRVLKFALWDGEKALITGKYGIMQPVEDADTQYCVPDILGVPLLAFDLRGNRMGYGGGFYDATISELKTENPDLLTVGICYAKQAVLFNLPTEPHDQKLDFIITPQDIHQFT